VAAFPSCYQPAPTQVTALNGLFYPWQRDLILARAERSPSDARADDLVWNNGQLRADPFSNTAQKATQAGGQKFWRMSPMQQPRWMEVDLRPTAMFVYNKVNDDPEPPPTYDLLRKSGAAGTIYCPWKCLVRWKEGTDIRSAIVDIGAGQLFSIPPTTQVSLDILIPNDTEESLANVIAPPNTRVRRCVCRIQAKVSCVYSTSGTRARYSEVYYLERGVAEGSVGGQFWVPEGTQRVQARFADVGDPFMDLTPKTDVRAALTLETARVPQGVTPDIGIVGPTTPMQFLFNRGNATEAAGIFASSVWDVVRVQIPNGSGSEAVNSTVCAELDL
jgi:hypothetical protein